MFTKCKHCLVDGEELFVVLCEPVCEFGRGNEGILLFYGSADSVIAIVPECAVLVRLDLGEDDGFVSVVCCPSEKVCGVGAVGVCYAAGILVPQALHEVCLGFGCSFEQVSLFF